MSSEMLYLNLFGYWLPGVVIVACLVSAYRLVRR